MTSIKVLAPAKVNLFLKVLNKRKDNYHNILTLFEKISLADDIKITKIPKGIVVSSDKLITTNPRDNIAYRAAELLLKHKKLNSGIKIEIKKRIPIAAGLGGGSSDAASVLIGMNKLFGLRLKSNTLLELASRLGSDVPFFILDAPFAIGRRKGERLERIDFRIRLWHLIIYPGFKLATKDIYEAYDASRSLKYLTRNQDGVKIQLPLKHSMDFDEFRSMLHNDLQKIVVFKEEVIGKIIKRLASLLRRRAIMSGSGPSVFCLFRTRKEAIETKKILFSSLPALERKDWQAFIARTMD